MNGYLADLARRSFPCVAAVVLFALAGCSSSTDLRSDTTADGIEVQLTTDTNTPVVGHWMTVTMTLLNTTDNTISRTFPADDWGPVPQSSSSDLEPNGFDGSFLGPFLLGGVAHTITFDPRRQFSHDFHFMPDHAGSASIVACFPESDAGPRPAACVSKSITMRAN